MPSYYAYGDYNPSALNPPSTGYWENTSEWPRAYQYTPTHGYYQGLHPPAPVYQSNQPANAAMYYYGQVPGAPGPQPYYTQNGYYYGAPQAPAPGWPYSSYNSHNFSYTCYPLSSPQPQNYFSNFYNPYSTGYNPYAQAPSYIDCANAQAAAAQVLAANAALALTPNAPFMFVGKTQAEIEMQNAILAAAYSQAGMMQQPGMPTQLAPYKPAATQQFWCKELDGSWTLREHQEVMRGELNPGHWEKHATSGYFYWVRHTA